MIPIYINQVEFPFYEYNVFFILSAVTFSRLLFQIKHSFLAHQLVLKFLFMFLAVVVFMLAYRGINLYNIFIDEKGHYFLVEHLPLEKRYSLAKYINWEFFFFGIASIVSAVIMPFRLLVSIFRVKNYGEE